MVRVIRQFWVVLRVCSVVRSASTCRTLQPGEEVRNAKEATTMEPRFSDPDISGVPFPSHKHNDDCSTSIRLPVALYSVRRWISIVSSRTWIQALRLHSWNLEACRKRSGSASRCAGLPTKLHFVRFPGIALLSSVRLQQAPRYRLLHPRLRLWIILSFLGPAARYSSRSGRLSLSPRQTFDSRDSPLFVLFF